MQDLYYTSDMGLASTLVALGFEIDHIENGKNNAERKFFKFKPNDKLPENAEYFATKYFAGALTIDPLALFTAHRRVKGYLREQFIQP